VRSRKHPLLFAFLLIACLPGQAVSATPPQRLIIQFDVPLSGEQQRVLNRELRVILKKKKGQEKKGTDLFSGGKEKKGGQIYFPEALWR
jgi:hypothetical protein